MTSVLTFTPMSFVEPKTEAFAQLSSDDISDIGNYVIYGLEKVDIKENVTIQSGNVGVHNDLTKEGKITIKIGTNFVDPESALVANKIKIEKDATIQNVFYNILENKGIILGSEKSSLSFPVVDKFPVIPDALFGTESIQVQSGETLSLSPGQYGDIKVKKTGVLVFEGGEYSITSINGEKDSTILFDNASELIIEDKIKMGDRSFFGPSDNSDITASQILIFVVGKDKISKNGDMDFGTDDEFDILETFEQKKKTKVEFKKESTVFATIFAPSGDIKIKKETHATGAFIAKSVKIEKDSTLTLDSSLQIHVLIDELEILTPEINTLVNQLQENLNTENEPSAESLALLTLIEQETIQISTIVKELQSQGVTVEPIVVQGSLIPTLLVTPAGFETREINLSNGACGAIMWLNVLEFTNNEVPLDFGDQITLLLSSVSFCADVGSFSPLGTETNLFLEGNLFMLTIATGALDLFADVDLVASALNQIDLREFWLQTAMGFDNNQVTVTDATGMVQTYRPILAGTIDGAVFGDSNQNMIFDSGEFGISGWIVEASFSKLNSNPVTFSEITQAVPNEGRYNLDDLPTGIYTVKETLMPDYIQTSPIGETHEFNIVAGSDFTEIDFGNFETAPPPPVITENGWFVGSNVRADEHFGYEVVISGNTAIVGAPQEDANYLLRSGAVYVFEKIGNSWIQQAILDYPNPKESGGFGHSIAISGDTALIGTRHGDEAYVFVKSGEQWGLQKTFTNPVTGNFNFFGQSVALSGNTAVIGDPSHPDYDTRSGAVYVYTRTGSTWTQEAQLTTLDAANHDRFGHSVSISGNTIVAGTFYAVSSADRFGSAYVFEKIGNTWTEQAKLKASDEAEWDFFGETVSISGDTIMIGANRDDDAGTTSGAVYVFEKSGTNWIEQKLTSSDASTNDGFGSSVFLVGDMALIGAPGADDDAGNRIGSVYVFSRNANTWTEDAIITASDPAHIDGFGRSVFFSGNTVIVGADQKDVPGQGQNAGAAYIFELQ